MAARAGVGKSTIYRHWREAERRQALIDLIELGVAAGELRSDLDPELATVALLGPIFYRRLMSGEPFDPARARDLVSTVLGPG